MAVTSTSITLSVSDGIGAFLIVASLHSAADLRGADVGRAGCAPRRKPLAHAFCPAFNQWRSIASSAGGPYSQTCLIGLETIPFVPVLIQASWYRYHSP